MEKKVNFLVRMRRSIQQSCAKIQTLSLKAKPDIYFNTNENKTGIKLWYKDYLEDSQLKSYQPNPATYQPVRNPIVLQTPAVYQA